MSSLTPSWKIPWILAHVLINLLHARRGRPDSGLELLFHVLLLGNCSLSLSLARAWMKETLAAALPGTRVHDPEPGVPLAL